jgi:hypothetical protein
MIKKAGKGQNMTKKQTQQKQNLEEQQQQLFFYLSDYMCGGCVTFTAHLVNKLKTNHVFLLSSSQAFENPAKDFGYGLNYHLVPSQFIDKVKIPLLQTCFET